MIPETEEIIALATIQISSIDQAVLSERLEKTNELLDTREEIERALGHYTVLTMVSNTTCLSHRIDDLSSGLRFAFEEPHVELPDVDETYDFGVQQLCLAVALAAKSNKADEPIVVEHPEYIEQGLNLLSLNPSVPDILESFTSNTTPYNMWSVVHDIVRIENQYEGLLAVAGVIGATANRRFDTNAAATYGIAHLGAKMAIIGIDRVFNGVLAKIMANSFSAAEERSMHTKITNFLNDITTDE